MEMVLRRVQYYQTWIMEPKAHSQILAAMFGHYSFERSSPILPDGQIDTNVAHPWLLQLVSDLDCVFEKLDDLALDNEVLKHRYHLLFLSHPEGSSLDLTCAHFMHFDFHSTRAHFFQFDKVVPSAAAGPSVSQVMHTCPISIAERECGLQFDSHMKLMAHIRFAHNGRNLLDL